MLLITPFPMIKGQLLLKQRSCQETYTSVKLRPTGFCRGDFMDKYEKARYIEESKAKTKKKKVIKEKVEEPKKSKLAE